MIRFSCSRCSSVIEVLEDRGGNIISCPGCSRPVRVPTFLPFEPAADTRPAAMGNTAQPGTLWFSKRRVLSVLAFIVRRFGSSAMLLLALVMFPLPWVQVQCNGPIGNSGTRILAEQSGLQMIYGGYSENPLLRDAQFERQRRSVQERLSLKEGPLPGSSWTALYALFLLSGILAGILVRSRPLRAALLMGCSVSVGLVLLVQARSGFPLERALPDTVVKRISLGETIGIEITSGTLLDCRYTSWFWLTVFAVLGSFAAACIDCWFTRPRQTAMCF